MVDPEPSGDSGRSERLWAVVRIILGLGQVMGATAAAYLLIRTGVSEWSLGAAAITLLLTTLSKLLFARSDRGA